MHGFYGDYSGFAPLAGAVQEAALGAGTEDALLLGVGNETEAMACEGDGVGVVRRRSLGVDLGVSSTGESPTGGSGAGEGTRPTGSLGVDQLWPCAMEEYFCAYRGQDARRWPGGRRGWPSSRLSSSDFG